MKSRTNVFEASGSQQQLKEETEATIFTGSPKLKGLICFDESVSAVTFGPAQTRVIIDLCFLIRFYFYFS